MAKKTHYRLIIQVLSRPQSVLILVFAGLILAGTVLLSLPEAHTRPGIGILDALFTATSAVCVTGLIVVDTGKDFTLFGQIVILTLIQFGGLGIMTFGALVMQMAGRKMSLRSQVVLHDVFYQQNAAAEFRQNLKWIIFLTLALEGLGALALFHTLPEGAGGDHPLYVSVFHAVSAFCNAGFSTFGDSLEGLRADVPFMGTIAALIVLGGLGYAVNLEILHRGWYRLTRKQTPLVWTLHSRVVLATSLALILGGAIIFDVLGLAGGPLDWLGRAGNALFQSITARTAGFNSVDIGALPTASLLWLMLLMFVGGSPGSCAGGIKTTSLAVWAARLRARLALREDVTIAGRRIPVELVRRTGLLLGVASVYNLVGVLILSITEMGDPACRLEDILFEQVSAFATVGLSTGLTPHLTTIGRLWIILTMFVGRLGPLTIAMAVMDRKAAPVRMPEERIMIG